MDLEWKHSTATVSDIRVWHKVSSLMNPDIGMYVLLSSAAKGKAVILLCERKILESHE